MPHAPRAHGSFRHAVLAAAVAFLGPRGVPEGVKVVGRGVASRVLRWLDARRAQLDPGLDLDAELRSAARESTTP
jgi:hypothetical protein